MQAFRAFLVLVFLVVVEYTIAVIAEHGLGRFGVFLGDVAKMG